MKTEHTHTPEYSHTDGPWLFDEYNGHITTANGTPIGQAFDNPDSGSEPICDSPSLWNGRLLAASPELLEALKETLAIAQLYSGSAEPGSIREGQIKRARAAIAKATKEVK